MALKIERVMWTEIQKTLAESKAQKSGEEKWELSSS